MTPWKPSSLLSSPSSSSSSSAAPAAAPSRWAALLARVRASAWGPVAIRVGAVVIALVVLGWIGRTAAAGPATGGATLLDRDASSPVLPAAPTLVPLDAGALPVTFAALPSSSIGAGPAPAAASGPRGRATPESPVYLNHASVDELRRLPGVGAKRAEAILVLRQRVGRFQRVEDLLRVKGIGRGAVKKWRPLVRLDAPSAPDGGSP